MRGALGLEIVGEARMGRSGPSGGEGVALASVVANLTLPAVAAVATGVMEEKEGAEARGEEDGAWERNRGENENDGG